MANVIYSAFPAYDEISFHNIYHKMTVNNSPPHKLVEQTIRTPGRQPSPQPAHFNGSNGHANGSCHNGHNGHRILRSATVGYVAPTFEGKKAQMEEGQ
jgi:glutamate dehydrogenase